MRTLTILLLIAAAFTAVRAGFRWNSKRMMTHYANERVTSTLTHYAQGEEDDAVAKFGEVTPVTREELQERLAAIRDRKGKPPPAEKDRPDYSTTTVHVKGKYLPKGPDGKPRPGKDIKLKRVSDEFLSAHRHFTNFIKELGLSQRGEPWSIDPTQTVVTESGGALVFVMTGGQLWQVAVEQGKPLTCSRAVGNSSQRVSPRSYESRTSGASIRGVAATSRRQASASTAAMSWSSLSSVAL